MKVAKMDRVADFFSSVSVPTGIEKLSEKRKYEKECWVLGKSVGNENENLCETELYKPRELNNLFTESF